MIVRILGRGKVGRALHAALRKTAMPSSLHRARGPLPAGSASATTYVLAVPDAQIGSVAARLAPVLGARDVVLHCSGNRGLDELAACRRRGARVATMHPMVSFASPRAPPALRGTTWVVHGDAVAQRAARRLARAVGARAVEGASGHPVYHAAAAILANGGAALAALSVQILESRGVGHRAAELACAGLLRSVAHNVERVGVPGALTGPIARGDADTVRSHVLGLRAVDASLADSYVALGPLIVACAMRAGLPRQDAVRVEEALRRPEAPVRSGSTRARKPRG